MKKFLLKIAASLFVGSILLTSCSKEETEKETCTGENYPIEINKFVKKVTTHVPGQVIVPKEYNYSYNEFNLLSNKKQIENSILKNDYSYNYICSNSLKERSEINTDSDKYEFDLENRLIGFNTSRTFNADYKLTYDGNRITVEHRENGTSTLFLETNEVGLVIKITREWGHSTVFEYDVNGNITKVEDFRTDGSFEKGYEVIYDQNPNPFYGQLSSVYLERVISNFYISSRGITGVLFMEKGYEFPYFKNNPVLIKYINNVNETVLTMDYEYNDENYPVRVIETFGENPNSITYYLEYK